jgi:hypothetical protein
MGLGRVQGGGRQKLRPNFEMLTESKSTGARNSSLRFKEPPAPVRTLAGRSEAHISTLAKHSHSPYSDWISASTGG